MSNQAAVAAFFLLVLAVLSNFEVSASSLVRGNVSCLDCHRDFDFSGIKILLKCDGEKKPVTAMAASDGSFRAALPTANENVSRKCLAKLLGGPEQLYGQVQTRVQSLNYIKPTYVLSLMSQTNRR